LAVPGIFLLDVVVVVVVVISGGSKARASQSILESMDESMEMEDEEGVS